MKLPLYKMLLVLSKNPGLVPDEDEDYNYIDIFKTTCFSWRPQHTSDKRKMMLRSQGFAVNIFQWSQNTVFDSSYPPNLIKVVICPLSLCQQRMESQRQQPPPNPCHPLHQGLQSLVSHKTFTKTAIKRVDKETGVNRFSAKDLPITPRFLYLNSKHNSADFVLP